MSSSAPGEPLEPTDQDLDVLLKNLGNLVTPMALRVAATLRLVDHLLAGADTLAGLADRTGAHPQALARLVRHLSVVGVLEGGEKPDQPLRPTRLGMLLADGHPAQQRAWLDLDGAVSHADLAFTGLLDVVRTGRPAYAGRYGRPFWEDLSADVTLADSFDALMSCDEDLAYEAPADAYDWSAVRHVLDVGGGNGGILAAIALRAPHLRGTLLELAGPAERARRRFADAGLADRVAVAEGDFFKPLPVTADVVLLSFVLLNWSDEDALTILRGCVSALEPGGKVLVLDRADVEGDGADRFFSTLLDLRMLTFMGGRVRTRDEVVALAASAGLALASERTSGSTTLPFDFSILEFTAVSEEAAPASEALPAQE
ncbi:MULTISPECIES: methyltransferase [Streptomyces]|uniref:Methyltransferase domain-containing protein n=1 Tax=Streptomyces koelreuteriae TaxID=2838015 RepID=A0ABX8FSD2_9ACTN|nr:MULTISPECIES: methyltransferase [Streptomyces]QWB24011.1 methyltransferase domain-containing protein [Streptomyces koelreuteriae]UUA06995.1 methyltransferase domain-containing protein [Streptomyces koelreuteriae]UUA14624.1 methyltransferase domain-containing protein [Streptomyces sp. CRCS-T-1]